MNTIYADWSFDIIQIVPLQLINKTLTFVLITIRCKSFFLQYKNEYIKNI